MTESKRGIFQRGSAPFIEVEAARSDDYMTFAWKAADCCQLGGNSLGTGLSLFKMNGARILNRVVTVKGNKKPWTLGNYLLMMKKSPASVKIGVGYVDESSTSSEDNVRRYVVSVWPLFIIIIILVLLDYCYFQRVNFNATQGKYKKIPSYLPGLLV